VRRKSNRAGQVGGDNPVTRQSSLRNEYLPGGLKERRKVTEDCARVPQYNQWGSFSRGQAPDKALSREGTPETVKECKGKSRHREGWKSLSSAQCALPQAPN